ESLPKLWGDGVPGGPAGRQSSRRGTLGSSRCRGDRRRNRGVCDQLWLLSLVTPGRGPASAGARTEAQDLSALGAVHLKLVELGRLRLASVETGGDAEFAFWEPDDRTGSLPARQSFGERFAFDEPSAPWSLQPAQTLASFDDRFGGEGGREGL